MNRVKKIGLYATMTLVICITTLITSGNIVNAEELMTEDGYVYEVQDEGVVITGYSGTDTKLIIPSEIDGEVVIGIGEGDYSECEGIYEILIPDSIIKIENCGLFKNGLEKISVDTNNIVYDSRNNCNAIIETASNKLIVGCKNTTIPESVIAIGEAAFSGSGIVKAHIPDNITSIEKNAFSNCMDMTSVYISKNLKSIEQGVFASTGLIEVIIPSGVKGIESQAFQACPNLKKITIPGTVTYIGDACFLNCFELTSVQMGNGLKTIGELAFQSCPLKKVKIPGSVSEIKSGAFSWCDKMTTITLSSKLTEVSDGLFFGCENLKEVKIPNSVKVVGKEAFWGCKRLKKITMGTGVTTIKSNAFDSCAALKNVTVKSKKLKIIEKYAFKNCKKLIRITLKTTKVTKKSIGKNALKGTNKKLVIKVPKNKVKKYKIYFKNKGNKTVIVKN